MPQPRDVPALTQSSGPGPARDGRVLSIDRFRGALVLLMVVANYLSGVAAVPAFLKHTPDVGLTIIDVGAPCFVFAMGLTYRQSFERRYTTGRADAYRHVVVRYLALIGIGAILSAGGTQVAGQPSDWGVLQALGAAGLLCLPVIRLGTTWRFAIGGGLLIVYQVLADAVGVPVVRDEVQGGLIGALSWGALLILSTAVADLWRRGTAPMLWCCSALAAVGAISAFLVPVSKTRVSLSYILLALAIGALGFLLVDLLSHALPPRAGYVAWWGENALLLYILHLLLLGLVVLPPARWWYVEASPWLVAAQLVTIVGVLSVIAWWLHRAGRRVRL